MDKSRVGHAPGPFRCLHNTWVPFHIKKPFRFIDARLIYEFYCFHRQVPFYKWTQIRGKYMKMESTVWDIFRSGLLKLVGYFLIFWHSCWFCPHSRLCISDMRHRFSTDAANFSLISLRTASWKYHSFPDHQRFLSHHLGCLITVPIITYKRRLSIGEALISRKLTTSRILLIYDMASWLLWFLRPQ